MRPLGASPRLYPARSLSAEYDSSTTQFFGEVGHRIDAGAMALEPFAGFAHVRVRSDAFVERGGLAALYGNGSSVEATFSTLVVRARAQVGERTRVRGLLCWRHSFGDTAPTSTHAFAGSSWQACRWRRMSPCWKRVWRRSCGRTWRAVRPTPASSAMDCGTTESSSG